MKKLNTFNARYSTLHTLKSLSITERQIWLPNSEVETNCPLGPLRARSLYFRVEWPNMTLRYGNCLYKTQR